jgi:hypothetical protein
MFCVCCTFAIPIVYTVLYYDRISAEVFLVADAHILRTIFFLTVRRRVGCGYVISDHPTGQAKKCLALTFICSVYFALGVGRRPLGAMAYIYMYKYTDQVLKRECLGLFV